MRGVDRCLHLRTDHVAVWIPQHLLDARPVRGPVTDDGLGTRSPDKRSHPIAQLRARTSDPLCEALADREEIDWCVLGHEHLDALCVQFPLPRILVCFIPLASRRLRTSRLMEANSGWSTRTVRTCS